MTAALQCAPVQQVRAGRTSSARRRIRTIVAHPMQVNILAQARETVDPAELTELANNIALLGLLQMSSVGEMTPRELRIYLKQHNVLWGTNYRMRDMLVNLETGTYLVACFGHRRILAHQQLWDLGCGACSETFGVEAPGTCWRRHSETLDPDGMELRAVRGLEWIDAMYAQLAENTQVAVPRDREAKVWRALWDIQRSRDPRSTIKVFARKVGRSPEIVSEALRFCDLPDEVRAAVADKHIAWGVALELVRMQSAGCSESDIIFRKNYAIVHQPIVARFHQLVSGILAERAMTQGQDGMFELCVEEIRSATLGGDLELSAVRTLESQQRDLLAKLAAMKAGHLPGYEDALRTPAVQRALAGAQSVHAGLNPAVLSARPTSPGRVRAAS